MSESYTDKIEPSHFIAQKLDNFMHLFSFVRESTEEELLKLPRYGFRIAPSEEISIKQTMGFTLNSFPYFMLTRIFPYLHYYHDYSECNQVVLTIIYFDFYINYVIDIQQMQLACPVSILDLQACKSEIKRVVSIIQLNDSITEICMNQPVFPRLSLQEYL